MKYIAGIALFIAAAACTVIALKPNSSMGRFVPDAATPWVIVDTTTGRHCEDTEHPVNSKDIDTWVDAWIKVEASKLLSKSNPRYARYVNDLVTSNDPTSIIRKYEGMFAVDLAGAERDVRNSRDFDKRLSEFKHGLPPSGFVSCTTL